MTKTALMIAFHLPPSNTSSGHLRPLGFAKFLPTSGWQPIMLSAHEGAYPSSDAASVSLIPESAVIHRAFALDTKRHLGICGKYPSILALPDRWMSWWPAAIYRGLRLIRRHNVQAIWSTYPIMTAHCIAYTLSRLSGVPWIADFRDPVTSSIAMQNRLSARTQMYWERRILSRARYSVFTTPGAMRSYADRYPKALSEKRLQIIPNGFDEDDFAELPPYRPHQGERALHLVHAGVLYPSGRSPIPFFEALAKLRGSGFLGAHDVKVTLRASGSEELYSAELARLGLDEMVSLAPILSYREALAEQSQADGLLLFQGEQYDNQVPAKLYEYLRIGRPIFALLGTHGDTAKILRESGGATLVPLDDVPTIQRELSEFVRALQAGRLAGVSRDSARKYSRREGTLLLADLLDRMVQGKTK